MLLRVSIAGTATGSLPRYKTGKEHPPLLVQDVPFMISQRELFRLLSCCSTIFLITCHCFSARLVGSLPMACWLEAFKLRILYQLAGWLTNKYGS